MFEPAFRNRDAVLRKEAGSSGFVMANPPFNVNAADKELLNDMVGFDANGPPRRSPCELYPDPIYS